MMATDSLPYAVQHETDDLGGVYPRPIVTGRFATLREAIGAALREGCGSYVAHLPSGKQRHHVPDYGVIWLDRHDKECEPPEAD